MSTVIQVAYVGPGYVIDGRGIVEDIIFDQDAGEILYRGGRTEVFPEIMRVAIVGVTAEALATNFEEDLWGSDPDVIVSTEMMARLAIHLPGEGF